jgi:hypothetical protein
MIAMSEVKVGGVGGAGRGGEGGGEGTTGVPGGGEGEGGGGSDGTTTGSLYRLFARPPPQTPLGLGATHEASQRPALSAPKR